MPSSRTLDAKQARGPEVTEFMDEHEEAQDEDKGGDGYEDRHCQRALALFLTWSRAHASAASRSSSVG